jgi:CO/xanthine dehydrogenase FAD-binding subunit
VLTEGKYLSGGMTLIATMKQRLASPSDLVDLRHIPDLKGIRQRFEIRADRGGGDAFRRCRPRWS